MATHDSLKNQSCNDYEWIVIDGDSADDTLEYLSVYPPDQFICEADNGPYDAMNKGISLATGRYALFLNAGDTLADAKTLEHLKKKLAKNPDFIYGDSYDQNGNKNHYKKARSHQNAKWGMFTHHQSMIYKTKLLEHLRYDTRYKIAADYDLTLRFLQNCKTIKRIGVPISIFEGGGLSQKRAKHGRLEQQKIRKELKLCNPLENKFIMCAQKTNAGIRHYTPTLYWFLKRASRL